MSSTRTCTARSAGDGGDIMTESQIRIWNSPQARFKQHQISARNRGIIFKFTFEQWWKIWQDSGHWEQRGCHRNQYCMARNGDLGCYEIGNVSIVPVMKNQHDKKQSKKARMLMSIPKRGENNSRAYLTEKRVKQLRKAFAKNSSRGMIAQLSKKFDIPYGTTYGIIKGVGWRHL